MNERRKSELVRRRGGSVNHISSNQSVSSAGPHSARSVGSRGPVSVPPHTYSPGQSYQQYQQSRQQQQQRHMPSENSMRAAHGRRDTAQDQHKIPIPELASVTTMNGGPPIPAMGPSTPSKKRRPPPIPGGSIGGSVAYTGVSKKGVTSAITALPKISDKVKAKRHAKLMKFNEEDKAQPKLPHLAYSANTGEWVSKLVQLLKDSKLWIDRARERKQFGVYRADYKTSKEYWKGVEAWRERVKICYDKGISVLKAGLSIRPQILDEEGRNVAAKLVNKILQLHQASLDTVEAREEVPTSTPGYKWLEEMYNEYDIERRKICGPDSTLDNPFAFKFEKTEIPSTETWEWTCINSSQVGLRQGFRQLILARYPYMSTILLEMAQAHASLNNFKEATRYSSHALHIVTETQPQDYEGQLMFWRKTKKYHASQRLSPRSFREFIKWQIALRAQYLKSNHPLMFAMRTQARKLASNTAEKLGNILLVYSGYIAIIFTILWFSYSSACAGIPQNVTVDELSFSNPDGAVVFNLVSKYPSCAADCQDTSQATCTNYDCPCIDVGCECWCVDPMFDSCTFHGSLRREMRDNLYLVYFAVSALEIMIFIGAIGIVSWPNVPVETEALRSSFKLDRFRLLEDSAILIATHAEPTAIKKSIAAALKIFRPDQIYCCHNGPTRLPNDGGATRRFCEDIVKEKFPDCKLKINYSWTSEPNKTLALYMNALKKCTQKFVMITDNDVMLPEDMYIPTHRFDEKVKALCFTIKAENLTNADGSANWLTNMQDIEYKKAGLTKMLQSKLGTTFYAHGAIAMWERETMIEVLGRHNTMFHGEDLQMGYIMHMMNKDYRMKTVGAVSVPTTVPNHLICYPYHYSSKKHWLVRAFAAPFNCEHDEKSLFQQRAKSWDAAAHRVLLLFVNLFFLIWTRGVLALKPFLIYETWSVIQDWMRIPFAIIIIATSGKVGSWLFGMFTLYWVQVGLLFLMNYWTFRHRRDLRSDPRFIVVFPAYNGLLLGFRLAALAYNALVYLPLERNKQKIKNRTYLPTVLNWNSKEQQYVAAESDDDDDDDDDDSRDSDSQFDDDSAFSEYDDESDYSDSSRKTGRTIASRATALSNLTGGSGAYARRRLQRRDRRGSTSTAGTSTGSRSTTGSSYWNSEDDSDTGMSAPRSAASLGRLYR